MRFSILLSMCIFLAVACKTKEYTPYDYKGEIMVFGGGGGFSGKVTQYTLMSNGQFFRGTHKEGKVIEFPRIEKKQAKQLFDSYHNLGFDDLNLMEGGNLYKFVKMYKDGQEHVIQWGDSLSDPPKSLLVYQNNLMALARKANKQVKEINANYQVR